MGTTPCFLHVSWVNILCALRFMSAECNHCREKWVGPATWYMFPRLWRMQGSVQTHSWKVHMLNRPRAQKEERVTVGRGEREQRKTLEEGSQHCIFPEVIPPRWTHVKRSDQKGSIDSQGELTRGTSAFQGIRRHQWRAPGGTHKSASQEKECAIGWHHPSLSCPLISPSLLLIQLSEAQAAVSLRGEEAKAGLSRGRQ